MSRPWLSPRCQHNTFTNDRAAESGELITRSGFHVLDNPGARNKLQPLKADRYIHNESSELSETHGASRNPGRTKTNIWSCKLSLHQPPPSSPHNGPALQFETRPDDWANNSQHFECLAFGGRISNHICVLLLYVWAGTRRCGILPTDEEGRERVRGLLLKT